MILSLALEAPREARRLQHQAQLLGGADFLGVWAWDKAMSRFLRARPPASRSWTVGLCIGFEIMVD
eukprot:672919-Alexandrium_andersonii.AAC.1